MKYRFPKKNPIFSVTFRTYDNLGAMQRTLAWQWLLGHVDYKKVCNILLEEETYVIADDTESRLVVVPQLVYQGKTYAPETDSKDISENGVLKGCYVAAFNSVYVLPNPDLALDFITRLHQVEDLWAKVKDGKDLPEEEPPLREKKTKKPKKKIEQEEQTPEAQEEQPEVKETKEETEQQTVESSTPLRDYWGQLSKDNVAKRLNAMRSSDLEEFFDELLTEYNKEMMVVEQYARNYLIDMRFYATAVREFNGKDSSAAKFLRDLDSQGVDLESKNHNPKPDNTLNNFVSRHLKDVEKWIEKAKAANDDVLLDLLYRMKTALNNASTAGNTDEYKMLKKQYDRITSADQQKKNPPKDSSNGDNQSDESGDSSSKDKTGEDNSSKGEEQQKKSEPPRKTRVTVGHVFEYLELYGIDEKPKMLKGDAVNLDQKVSLDYINKWLKDLGYDEQIPPEE